MIFFIKAESIQRIDNKMETRKNTLKLAFAQSDKVPIHLDVLRFIMRVLKVPAADVHSVYKDENDQRFYVKFMDDGTFNRFSSNMEELISICRWRKNSGSA